MPPKPARKGPEIYDRSGNFIGHGGGSTPEADDAHQARKEAKERLADRGRAQRSGWRLPILGRHRKGKR